MKRLFLFVIVSLFFACSDKKSSVSIDDYVFIDTKGVLHTDNGCAAVSKIKGGAQPVKILEVQLLTEDNLNSICSQCVGKEVIDAFRLLFAAKKAEEEIEKEEAEEEYFNHSLGFNLRRWLYIKLKDKVEDIGTWYDFNAYLEDSELCWRIYNIAKNKGIDLPEYNKFKSDIDNYKVDEKCEIFCEDTVAVDTMLYQN